MYDDVDAAVEYIIALRCAPARDCDYSLKTRALVVNRADDDDVKDEKVRASRPF